MTVRVGRIRKDPAMKGIKYIPLAHNAQRRGRLLNSQRGIPPGSKIHSVMD